MKRVGLFERWNVPDYGDIRQVSHGAVAVDEGKCVGCGLCVLACPAGAISVADGKALFNVNRGCIFCGDCQAMCPTQSIDLKKQYRYSGKYLTLDRGLPKAPRL